jgi:hypothetical protein
MDLRAACEAIVAGNPSASLVNVQLIQIPCGSLLANATVNTPLKQNPLLESQAADFYPAMKNQNPCSTRDALRHHDPR